MKAQNGTKAQKWLDGRKNIFEKIATTIPQDGIKIWIHCASLGEFEQGRPVIEALKKSNPHYRILLTFFSPSGYEIRKDYEYADAVCYLPMDGSENAKRFISLVKPDLAVFVKYEFWYYYLKTLCEKNIPMLLISAAFRKQQPFFKWYGKLFREMLHCYTKLFVQDRLSEKLLKNIGIKNVVISGDTRYDRVALIAQQAKRILLIEKWKGADKLLIAGSTWEKDEILLQEAMKTLPHDWKLLIAPHEIDKIHLQQIEQLFENNTARYSDLNNDNHFEKKILIIDNIGMLSSLYRYGDVAFIGGGFTKGGIHNILEAAVFGMPVLFGPNYQKFTEAREMVAERLAFAVDNKTDFNNVMHLFMTADSRKMLKEKMITFMKEKEGATNQIVEYIQSVTLHKLADR